ncbi:MAG: VanZ family protein [Chloracidobacterium sp.]|nr:VanZ family protein [Chloracidobacterium sp.]
MDFLQEENFWLYAPLILWISGTLYLSSNKGSVSRTIIYFAPMFHLLFPSDDAQVINKNHVFLRKLCHFAGYAILALLASIVFYNSSLLVAAKFWHAGAFAVVLVVASIDEIRQSFYPERHGSLSDVALDCLGGLTMILVFWIIAASAF